tara:strand:+ start:180 stop:752 length:573 start_codon:yes stop_codon:yes gene_type:complete
MKRIFILAIFFFSLQPSTNADDISDFEIEGMSIGDSALRYIDKGEIDNLPSVMQGEYKKSILQINLKQYDSLIITYKNNDKDYIIAGLTGNIPIYSKINDCYKKMQIIEEEISQLFINLNKTDWGILKLDKEYQTYNPITYDFDNGDRIQIACYDFRKSKTEDNDRDLLKLSLYTSGYRTASKFEAEKAD